MIYEAPPPSSSAEEKLICISAYRKNDKEKNALFRDYILWKEGLDIEKQHCLFINFGVDMQFEYPQIRTVT